MMAALGEHVWLLLQFRHQGEGLPRQPGTSKSLTFALMAWFLAGELLAWSVAAPSAATANDLLWHMLSVVLPVAGAVVGRQWPAGFAYMLLVGAFAYLKAAGAFVGVPPGIVGFLGLWVIFALIRLVVVLQRAKPD